MSTNAGLIRDLVIDVIEARAKPRCVCLSRDSVQAVFVLGPPVYICNGCGGTYKPDGRREL